MGGGSSEEPQSVQVRGGPEEEGPAVLRSEISSVMSPLWNHSWGRRPPRSSGHGPVQAPGHERPRAGEERPEGAQLAGVAALRGLGRVHQPTFSLWVLLKRGASSHCPPVPRCMPAQASKRASVPHLVRTSAGEASGLCGRDELGSWAGPSPTAPRLQGGSELPNLASSEIHPYFLLQKPLESFCCLRVPRSGVEDRRPLERKVPWLRLPKQQTCSPRAARLTRARVPPAPQTLWSRTDAAPPRKAQGWSPAAGRPL